MATRQKDPAATIQYLVLQAGNEFIIEISAAWKVTFGAVNPGSPPHGRDLHCVRIWEGEKLRAVFCDVRGFRDLSIPLARKVSKETGSASWTMDSEGNFEGNSNRQIETHFAADDPEAPEPSLGVF